jgi:predicted amidohydrolase
MRDIRVATVQFQHAAGDKGYNLGRVRHFVTEAARSGVEIIAFPEMCLTGYWHVRKLPADAVSALAEPVPAGPSSQELLRLSREHGMTIGAGLIERAADGQLYNAYVVAMPDGRWAVHRKLHVFVSAFLTQGDRYTVFDTPHGCRVGVLICYDNNIVENARATALLGAEILLAPHQTGGCNSVSPRGMKPVDQEIWARRDEDPAAAEAELCGPKGRGWLMRWLPSRAHDNGMFLVFSNGVGVDDDEIRTAESRALGDDLVVADLDASLLPTSSGRRWLRARRPELYEGLTRRTGEEMETRRVRFGE